jgi:hypothetical protein
MRAMLLARIFEILPLTCPHCGGEVRIIVFITEAPTVRAILECVGESVKPPPISSARGPPAWDDTAAQSSHADALAQSEPAYEFDQQVSR